MASKAVLDGRPLDDALSWVKEVETPFTVITAIRNVETEAAAKKSSSDRSDTNGNDDRRSRNVSRKARELAGALVDAGVRVVNPPAGSSPAASTGRSISFVVRPEDAHSAVRVVHACLFEYGSDAPTDEHKRVRSAKARLSPAGCDS